MMERIQAASLVAYMDVTAGQEDVVGEGSAVCRAEKGKRQQGSKTQQEERDW
jgi:hypothetical protein